METPPNSYTPRPKNLSKIKVWSCGQVVNARYIERFDHLVCDNGDSSAWDLIGVRNSIRIISYD